MVALACVLVGGCYRLGERRGPPDDGSHASVDATPVDAGGTDGLADHDADALADAEPSTDAGVADTGVDVPLGPGRWAWVVRRGDALWQEGYRIASRPSGVSAVSGSLDGYIDFGSGPVGDGVFGSDLFVALLEPSPFLDTRWVKRYGCPGSESVTGLAFASDGSLVLSGHASGSIDFGTGPLAYVANQDIFLVKLAPDGSTVFARSFGSTAVDALLDVAVTPSDEIVAVGRVANASIDFGGGPLAPAGSNDAVIGRFDASGNHLWSRRYGNVAAQSATGVAVASDPQHAGATVVVGTFAGALQFESGTLITAGGSDIFVVGLDDTGHALWGRRFGDAADQTVESIAFDPLSGTFAITGSFQGTVDFGGGPLTSSDGWDGYVAVFSLDDVSISHEWSVAFGGGNEQRPLDVAFDYAGHVVAVGFFRDALSIEGQTRTSAGGKDLFAARLGPSGALVWLETAGDADDQVLASVTIDAANRIRVVGSLVGAATFDGETLVATGHADVVVGELIP